MPARAGALAVRSVLIDRIAAEVVSAFRARGVDCFLLKGASFARWLYDEPAERPYGDIDLLVAPEGWSTARETLRTLGFEARWPEHRGERPRPAELWMRERDRSFVDLHRRLWGAEASPDVVWTVLSRSRQRLDVGGGVVDVLSEPARAMHAGTHAAQHGTPEHKPLEDLSRALDRVPPSGWEQAAALAHRIGAVPAFAAGLRLLPAGRRVADRLGLPTDRPAEVALRAAGAPPLALGFDRLARTPGVRRKLGLVARRVVPSPDYVREWSPLARRGRSGLVAAYAARPLWLLWRSASGYLAWRRARRPRPGPDHKG
jgi:hypothetical protein